MPPPFHPRSLTTSTLFTTTALLSFLIVGAPHVLPCPAGVNRLDQRRQSAEPGAEEKKEGKKKCPGLVGVVLGRGRGHVEEGEEEGIAGAVGKRVVFEGRK